MSSSSPPSSAVHGTEYYLCELCQTQKAVWRIPVVQSYVSLCFTCKRYVETLTFEQNHKTMNEKYIIYNRLTSTLSKK